MTLFGHFPTKCFKGLAIHLHGLRLIVLGSPKKLYQFLSCSAFRGATDDLCGFFKNHAAHALLLLLIAAPASAQVLPSGYTPWTAFGQTVIAPDTAICDPATNHPGTLGDTALPYTVPVGKVLVIDRGQVEALWGAGLVLYFNSPCTDNTKASNTIGGGPVWTGPSSGPAGATHDEVFGPYYIPAGVTVHLRLSSNWNNGGGWAYGWLISGYLMPASP